MQNGIVNVQSYSSTQATNQKSPLIWAPSQGIDLRDLSIGYIVDEHFDHSFWPSQLTFTGTGPTVASGVSYYTGTALSTATLPSGADHVLLAVPGSTAQGAGSGARVGFVTRPLRTVTPGGLYVIFEACVTTVQTAAIQGAFIGLTTSTGLILGTNILKTVSGTQASNALAANTGAIGFWMHGDTPNNFDAVYQGQSGTGVYSNFNQPSTAAASIVPTAGTIVLANVLTASTGQGDPGNVYQLPTQSWGVLTSTACVKLGLLFNSPTNQVIYTVNGYQVASANVSPAFFDTINDYGAIVEFGATDGGTASTGLLCDFIACAAKNVLA